MAGAGERIATSAEIRGYMDAIKAKLSDIDRIQAQIASTSGNITKTQAMIVDLQAVLAQNMVAYAAVMQGLIDNGISAAALVGNQLVIDCAREANDNQQKIAAMQSQVSIFQASNVQSEATIVARRAEIEAILGDQIAAVQTIMDGGTPVALLGNTSGVFSAYRHSLIRQAAPRFSAEPPIAQPTTATAVEATPPAAIPRRRR